MAFQTDIQQFLTATLGIRVYPSTIPEQEHNDAALYNISGGSRSSDSELCRSNIRLRRVRVIIVSKSALNNITYGDALYTALEGYGGAMGGTTVLYCRVDNEVDLTNNTQKTYEKTMDLSFKIQE